MLLPSIHDPRDLDRLDDAELVELAAEIRSFLIDAVSKTGGHLGPNLGVVELTLALHRSFTSPEDTLIFDTGHQAYVHKLITGRSGRFDTLRQHGGLSGYPSRVESPHDFMENSHASTGLSYALAVATAKKRRGEPGKTICVIGDGSLTGGMAYEALNNIGEHKPDLIIVINDNGRSYAPTVGGLAEHLGHLRLSPGYEAAKDAAGSVLKGLPVVGDSAYKTARRMKNSLKQLVAPISLFETLGMKYGGPIDGHDIRELERAFADASRIKGPVVVHVVTEKGRGYRPAMEDEIDKFHAVSKIDPASGTPFTTNRTWSDAFGDALVDVAERDENVVAITAAMGSSTGLLPFATRFPDRFFDVGIAEQHAVTFATGLALEGLKPVVCIFSTFLQRAYDQLLCDAALHEAGVTFVLDRAGITGEDGKSHHGIFDLAYLSTIPNMVIASPSSPAELAELLAQAVSSGRPFSIRYPRGAAPLSPPTKRRSLPPGTFDVVRRGNDVALVSIGRMLYPALEAAERLERKGIEATVVDARYLRPLSPELAPLLAAHPAVVTIEDGIVHGGLGTAVSRALAASDVWIPTEAIGLPVSFIEHGDPGILFEEHGLTGEGIEKRVTEFLRRAEQSVRDGHLTVS